jgi:hypothetical protein
METTSNVEIDTSITYLPFMPCSGLFPFTAQGFLRNYFPILASAQWKTIFVFLFFLASGKLFKKKKKKEKRRVNRLKEEAKFHQTWTSNWRMVQGKSQ